jgi:hypothetical protein
MKTRLIAALTVWATILPAFSSAEEKNTSKKAVPRKKVLIELYTSQGCESCPPAAVLMGRLAELGYGPEKIVPIAFHVDYFNTRWKDPFSSPEFSQRQMSYNSVKRRDDLDFTPMMMVDGRYPMLGSDRPRVLSAIKKALAERPEVSLDLTLERDGRKGKLTIDLGARSSAAVGRDLLVGVAITEDPVTTNVRSGENAGKTLVEHHVARSFAHKTIRLKREESRSLVFPLGLGADFLAPQCRVVVFAQDRANGKVYQADALTWTGTSSPAPTTVDPMPAE